MFGKLLSFRQASPPTPHPSNDWERDISLQLYRRRRCQFFKEKKNIKKLFFFDFKFSMEKNMIIFFFLKLNLF